jgi:hypothetical protein
LARLTKCIHRKQRRAREEFFELGSKALQTAAELVTLETAYFREGRDTSGQLEELQKQFEQQVSTLRILLQAGARESTRFYGHLGNYNAFVVSLTNLFQAALHLERKRQEESQYIARIQNELAAAMTAIAQEFQILMRPYSPGGPAAGDYNRQGFRRSVREAECVTGGWSICRIID